MAENLTTLPLKTKFPFLSKIREYIDSWILPAGIPKSEKLTLGVLASPAIFIPICFVGFYMGRHTDLSVFSMLILGVIITIIEYVIFFVWQGKKITKETYEQLKQQAIKEQTERLNYLGIMATATAHELNQPIGIIRVVAELGLGLSKKILR